MTPYVADPVYLDGCFLPLAEGTAITLLAPIFIVLLAQPMLGEKPTKSRWAASTITGAPQA